MRPALTDNSLIIKENAFFFCVLYANVSRICSLVAVRNSHGICVRKLLSSAGTFHTNANSAESGKA